VTIAYRTLNGSPDWTARFGRRGGTDFGWDVAASPDGERVYVTGVIFDPASLVQDFVTLGYSERDGSEEWSATYGGGDADDLPTVAVQPDSARVFLVGREWDDGDIIFETVAYEPPR
jgi:hypothetical protein